LAFDLERLFVDVFAPRKGDIVTILYDLPHDGITDNPEWEERRAMAESWQATIAGFAGRYGIVVKPVVTYEATGSHNSDMPDYGACEGKRVSLDDVMSRSTIVISIPEYSASAPLFAFTRKYHSLRVASMPMATKSMEETGLSADYRRVAAACGRLSPLFERAVGIEVTFSTGHTCYFDLSDDKPALSDDGLLPPDAERADTRLRNLPSGEVATCPKEGRDSKTRGDIPAVFGDETVVFTVEHNLIVDIAGDGSIAERMRREFSEEPALRNIAEVAIGCNDKAVVTGNVLEDEKAGFHWAYGRSDFLGGSVGPEDFTSPDRVFHKDIVYARGNPVVCSRLDFVFPDGSREAAVVDGDLTV
jgi:hypothetical protein